MGKWGIIFFSEEIAKAEAFKKTLKKAEDIANVEKYIELLRKEEAESKKKK